MYYYPPCVLLLPPQYDYSVYDYSLYEYSVNDYASVPLPPPPLCTTSVYYVCVLLPVYYLRIAVTFGGCFPARVRQDPAAGVSRGGWSARALATPAASLSSDLTPYNAVSRTARGGSGADPFAGAGRVLNAPYWS